jgi:hypothetical protein
MDTSCDQMLDRIISHDRDDDVAIIAVRCHPTDENRQPDRPWNRHPVLRPGSALEGHAKSGAATAD